jgi:O-methyltransferase
MAPGSPRPPFVRKTKTLLTLLRQRAFGERHDRERAGYALLDKARRVLLPDYKLTEYGKLWFYDREYFSQYRRLGIEDDLSADRKFLLRELLKLADRVEGDTVEAGVYNGASSWFICEARKDHAGTHWAFDSFEGLSSPADDDGTFWHEGDFAVPEQVARSLLEPYGAEVVRGWIPQAFGGVEGRLGNLAFVHIDVDLYEPTRDSLEFLYPRVAPGGIVVCDDYGSVACPGATRAVDDYMADRPEPVLHFTTGQGVIVKV